MATKTLGLTGRDYSTLAAWASYVNALSLSADEILEVYNDGGAVADTAKVIVGGWTANGHSVTMRPASGQGFKDHANKLTNALRWNASNGAALTNSVGYDFGYVFVGANLTVQDLQFRTTANSSHGCVQIATSAITIHRCIVSVSASSGSSVITQTSGSITINDSLLLAKGNGVNCNDFNAVRLNNCTVAGIGSSGKGIKQPYTAGPIVKNTVVFGFSTDYEGTAGTGSTNNATDKAGFGGTGWGTSGQTSVTSADFENVSTGTEDFRIKAGSTKLIDTGAASVGSGSDVVGTTRTGTRDIGAWEFASGGGSPTLAPADGSHAHAADNLTLSASGATNLVIADGAHAHAADNVVLAVGNALVLPALKNNAGTVLASETGATAFVYNVSTGALVVKKTGQTTNGSGVMTVVDASIVSGTTYRVVIVLASGAEGMDKVAA